jgi:glycosyltransferase involved in cell wall biosynthesis
MLVSFIIPAYNAADTIERCLDSIVTQSWGDMSYEIIIIDDASADGTVRVIEEYRERLRIGDLKFDIGNLTLLRQSENHRQGAARNRGVKIAKGEYICFVDADDAVTEGVISAIRMAEEKDADMVAFHYDFLNDRGEIVKEAKRLSFKESQVFSGIEMQNAHPYWCSGPVPYVYSKTFLDKVAYPFVEDVIYEDSDFVAVHLYYARRMVYSTEMGYHVYFKEGSTTHSLTHKNVADYLLLGVRMLRFYERIVNEGVNCKVYGVEEQQFAEGILEGACWNVDRACKRLFKLKSLKELRAYYVRIDAQVNRNELINDNNLRKYYWNVWTGLCIGYKQIAIALSAIMMPIYKLLKKV